ncbi:MAG: RNA-binding S4 domain-containing protein [Nitrospiraceae bacterium]|nr:RNA-binding S4 domain-containing protein [Nitrospiraceae bacterium]
MEEFKLKGSEYIELHSLLKVTGVCTSGGMAKNLIADGKVSVNGTVELRKRCKIRAGQTVTCEGRAIAVT